MSHDGKTYWKSVGQLAGDPGARAFLEREFPEGASEPPEGVTRREVLVLLGASLSLAGITGCRRPEEKIVPYVSAPEEIIPGVPRHYATTMPAGNSAYGLVVESHEGRPTKIEGNELHPSTAGSSSVWIQASTLDLYDPDRSQIVRNGEEEKTWADFVTAWGSLEEAHLEDAGAGLALLAPPASSPTASRLASGVRARFPRSRWATYEPLGDENVHAGIENATGRALQAVHHFERAKVILSLDADFLFTEREGVRNARGFADGRRVTDPSDSMSRLYVVEGPLSLTGANADHRLRLRSGDVEAFVALLAERLKPGLYADTASAPEVDPRWIEVLAEELMAHRGESLIVAGAGQPASVHAAVASLNVVLGNVGTTLTYHEAPHAVRSSTASLVELVGAMRSGEVKTLVILGGNPAYDSPVDLDFAGALAQVEHVVALSSHVDETSRSSTWHVPLAHYLESWGDAAAADGTLSVVQPLIAPLFGGKSAIELLGLMATGAESPGYDLVRETWRSILGEVVFEKRWSRVLHDGLLKDSAEPAVDVLLQVFEAPSVASAGDGLEVVFRASPAMFDGRFANNGWLLELPDPITKLTWENAALVSPATAGELGLANGDVARVTYRDRTLSAPVFVVPGQADGSVTLPLGWGRVAAGRLGNGRGFNAYALRTSGAPEFDGGLGLEATGSNVRLATTQDHHTVDELGKRVRDERIPLVVREATLAEYRQRPEFAREMVEHPPLVSPWDEHSYEEGYQWGMSIDLAACTGCNACVTACQSENNIPIVGKEQVINGREMHWLRVDRYFSGGVDEPQTVFQPIPCMQCENAPCEQVCPVAATTHDAEGLNTMIYNRCIGTRYCSNNCPYKVRRFNYFNFTKDMPEIQKLGSNPDVTVRSRGVMEKCTYCTQRINATKISAKLEGRTVRDGEVRTACEQACPSRAITFGNIRDSESAVSLKKGQARDYTLLAELNNKPRTTFLAKLRNPNPKLSEGPDRTESHG